MISLLCSVDIEKSELFVQLGKRTSFTFGSKEFVSGSLAGQEVLLCAGGMGKVNAAHATTIMFGREFPDALIIFGIGGAYPSSGVKLGDVAVAKVEIAGDEGVLTHDGFKNTEYMGIPLLKIANSRIYNTYPASEPLLGLALNALTGQSSAGTVHAGSFVTVSTCTGTRERALELEMRYGAICENMEGAAAAHVAMSHGVPWFEIRGISNIVEDREPDRWDIPRAAHAAQNAVRQILENWNP
jgi:futalosine hydrolase